MKRMIIGGTLAGIALLLALLADTAGTAGMCILVVIGLVIFFFGKHAQKTVKKSLYRRTAKRYTPQGE